MHASALVLAPAVPVPDSLSQLVVAARSGDADAARALYDRHLAATWGYCLAFARGDRQLAGDLVQEAFTLAFARIDELRDPAAFPGWLRQITRRVCLRWAQRRKTEQAALIRLAQEPRPQRRSEGAAVTVVAELIASCPDEGLRAVAQLFYREPPHSTAAIGELLGISRTAVTSRLHRFRAWAREQMLDTLAVAMEELR